MEHSLNSGMVLDGRYRIDRVLGEGGFGITYAAENIRIGLRVAIKEFFWHDHSTRDIAVSPCVSLSRAEDKAVFESQKERFLKEARILRDFSSLAGIVHIHDYFEENDTAYIVMEHVEGVTLGHYLADHGEQMDPEILLRRMLPLIDSLEQIHRSGVIHRDISPDNIMVTPSGDLKLIDFGAARQVRSNGPQLTTITKACYAPCEQYDKNGHQGAWTDVYALCATLYRCVTGAPPESALQRMFLDELKSPSQMGTDIAPAYEQIIMKGLQLQPEKRWQSMEELSKAIHAALPKPDPSPNPYGLLIGLLACLLCVALALGIWGWRRYDATHKFRGIETEWIRFEATKDTTAAEFAAAPEELRKRLEAFVGKDNYILTVDGDSMLLTLPLSAFDGREIWDVIGEHFSKLVPDKGTLIRYEYKANWEDPAHSMIAGINQVKPEALEGPTVMLRYDWNDPLTRGQRANLIVDFKARVDSLGVPYAFGSAYGNDDSIMLRIGLDRVGEPVLNTIGKTDNDILQFTALPQSSYDALNFNASMEFTERDGVPTGLRFSVTYDSPRVELAGQTSMILKPQTVDSPREDLEGYTRRMTEHGLNVIYLIDKERNPIARMDISGPITDGALEFRDFYLEGISSIAPEHQWLLEYYDTVLNKTKLPDECSLSGVQYLDADGHVSLKGVESDYGLAYVKQDTCRALREKLQALEKEHDFVLKEDSRFWLFLNLPLDDSLPGKIAAKLPALLADISDGQQVFSKDIYIIASDEQSDDQSVSNRNRIVISTDYSPVENRFENKCSMIAWGDAIKPWRESIARWWEAFDLSPYGLEKS